MYATVGRSVCVCVCGGGGGEGMMGQGWEQQQIVGYEAT